MPEWRDVQQPGERLPVYMQEGFQRLQLPGEY